MAMRQTSDALFVVPAKSLKTALRVGDAVRVYGRVFEDPGDGKAGTLTTLNAERIEKANAAAPAATVMSAPPERWEIFEGMRVTIDAPLSLNGSDARYAETSASFGGRLWTPSEIAAARQRPLP